jgi:hypothetical protein
MPTVSFVHPLLKKLLPQYELIRDCLAGEQQVKFRRDKYLPRPNAADLSPDNLARYNAYITRAVFYNVAQRTLQGLTGQVFLRDPAVEVPGVLKPVVEDATGEGVPLVQLAQQATDYALAFGRAGLFVDYPNMENPAAKEDEQAQSTSIAELESGDVRPTLRVIAPWDVINWRTKKKGAKVVLSLIVMREDYELEDDGFETKTGDQWRVLRLVEDQYVVEVYRDKNGAKPIERYFPKDFSGGPITELPFSFIGAVNNVANPALPPLYDLCSLNMAHYRNSADYEENLYFIGQPTPWFAGLTEEWVKNVMGGNVGLGARGSVMLPVGGSSGLLQADPNTLAKEGMDQKEAQMLALGAKLVEGSQVQRTATEADIDNTSETSVLSSVAKNVGAAFKWALEWACVFTGQSETGVVYDMNTEFDLVNLSPQERQQLMAEWQGGAITFEEYRASLRRAGIATLDDQTARTKIANDQADQMARAVEEAAKLAEATNKNEDDKPPTGEK